MDQTEAHIAALVIWFVAFCAIAARLNETRLSLGPSSLRSGRTCHPHGTLPGTDGEFEWNRFEGMTDAKVIFSEAHGSTIELEPRRGKRTCHIVIDPDAFFLAIVPAAPMEIELPLADFTDIGQIFTAIHTFVERL